MSTVSIPFVFLGDKKTSIEAAKFYKKIATKVEAEVYAQNAAMSEEWGVEEGALFHFETYWGTDGSAPVYMSATPFGGPVRGQPLLVFENTPSDIKRFHELVDKLSTGGKVLIPTSPKSWGEHAYVVDKFGVHWHLTYPK